MAFVAEAYDFYSRAEGGGGRMTRGERKALYVDAASSFLACAEQVGDPTCKSALLYLSASSAQKAAHIERLLNDASTSTTAEATTTSTTTTTSTKASTSVDFISHNGRLSMSASSRGRVSGTKLIPKAAALSSSSAVNDLLLLEGKLKELGLYTRRPSSRSSPFSLGTGGGGDYSGQNHAASALNESFLFLSSYQARQAESEAEQGNASSSHNGSKRRVVPGLLQPFLQARQSPSPKIAVPSSSSSSSSRTKTSSSVAEAANVKNVSTSVGGAVTTSTAASKVANSTKTLASAPSSSSASSGWSSILGWVGGGGGGGKDSNSRSGAKPLLGVSNGDCVIAGGNASTTSPLPLDASTNSLNYRYVLISCLFVCFERYAILTIFTPLACVCIYFNATRYLCSTISRSHSDDDDWQKTREQKAHGIRSGDGGGAASGTTAGEGSEGAKEEGILRLLASVKRLNDENYALMQRVETLQHLEQEHMRVQRDLSDFKIEYSDRFQRLKKALQEFAKQHATTNSSSGSMSSSSYSGSNINANSSESGNGTHVAEVEGVVGWEAATAAASEREKERSVSEEKSSSSSAVMDTIDANVRQKQLEGVCAQLMQRLTSAKAELAKKDKLIAKYDAYIKQKTVKAAGALAAKSSVLGAAGGGSEEQLAFADQNQAATYLQQAAVSGNVTAAAASGGGGGAKNSATLRSKHPSTSTFSTLNKG